MHGSSIAKRLFLSIVPLFALFALAMVLFQYQRELALRRELLTSAKEAAAASDDGTGLSCLIFALAVFVVAVLVLWRFTSRLGKNITALSLFADKITLGEPFRSEELCQFHDDELGQVAERIVSFYLKFLKTQKEQDKLKRELTRNIAHELRTPVASISGYLETILSNKDMPLPTQRLFLERCFSQTQRLAALVADILTINKMDALRRQNERGNEKGNERQEKAESSGSGNGNGGAAIDVKRVAMQIKSECALALEQKRMTFLTDLPDGTNVRADYSLVYSILRNLADNAIAYAGDGATIRLTAEMGNGYWQFRFADNGRGMDSRHIPRLFERFYRADEGRQRNDGGTGLGLAIVKNAVAAGGGDVAAETAPGQGLAIRFSLPAE